MAKVLDSAIANAYNNFNADVDDLKVTRIEVDPAPMFKRFQARAKGSGVRIAKRNSHILFRFQTVSERPGTHGSESKSDWHPPGHHARLEVEVVSGSKTFASNIHTDFLVRKFLPRSSPTRRSAASTSSAPRAAPTSPFTRPGRES